MDYRDIINKILNFFSNSFGQNKSMIIENGNSLSLTNDAYNVLEVLEDAGEITITDLNLESGTYPTELPVGFRSYGKFVQCSCTTGKIKLYKAR